MKRIYEKSRGLFVGLWIAAYCILMSVGDALSAELGCEKLITLPIAALMSAALLIFLVKNRLTVEYGLRPPVVGAGKMLLYLPVLLMLGANLVCGVRMNYTPHETVLYILTMLLVGFLEEVIFRGLLYGALKSSGVTMAAVISAVTFGVGHIVNLVNASGADPVSSFLQIIYATAAGFMFVMMYIRSKSLIVCIVAHGVFNALSAFGGSRTPAEEITVALILTLVTGGYALYLAVGVKSAPEAETAGDGSPEGVPPSPERENTDGVGSEPPCSGGSPMD